MKPILKKFGKILFIAMSLLVALILFLYLFVLPRLISNDKFIAFVETAVKENMNAELVIHNPVLKTSIKPEIFFSIDSLSLKKDEDLLLNLKNIDSKINLYKLFSKKITLEKLGADDIYIDINKLQSLSYKNEEKKKDKKAFFKLECFNTLFYIKNCTILYISPKGVKAKLLAKDLEISDGREPKYLHFKVFLDLYHNNEHLKLFFNDKDTIYFKDRKLHADNFKFIVEHSMITLNLLLDEKGHYDVTVNSDKFEIDNVRRFLETDLIIPNGHEFVSSFKDFTGDFNFKINFTDKGLNGFVKVNKVGAKLIPVADLPLTVLNGTITLSSNDIELKNFEGYYGKNTKNSVQMSGFVKDYTKTVRTEILTQAQVYDEFAKYLSKIAGMKINIINKASADFKINFAQNTKLEIKGDIKVPKGSDVLFEGSSISPTKYLRQFDIDMDILNDILTINHINYHIAESLNTNKNQKPFIRVKGNVNITNGIINEMGFDIPEPLPSEFFNVLIGQTVFRRGTFFGQMKYLGGKLPKLDGEMELKDTFIVGQAMIIKNMKVKSNGNFVNIASDGYIRRTKYQFNTNIINKIIFPIVVQNANLSFDEIDVEKIMQTFAPRPAVQPGKTPQNTNRPRIELAKSDISTKYFEVNSKNESIQTDTEDIQFVFTPNILEIKNCVLNIQKGAYKTMTFGNLHADLNLTPKGILEIKSNQFDLTDGISTLKVYCDFMKQKYSIRLGAKDVDTDAIATSILNLNKEISGKAKALLEFYTDKSMKLNGKIQFEINDGSIAKLGLVQYVLNMASVFRNPLAMISPSSIMDIVNIPEGTFKKINGTVIIKDNSIKGLMIKSSSPQLSSFIVGRINLENMDASLRIYTKFSNNDSGVFGFLRWFSLNAMAQKANEYLKGETVSYYSAELSQLPELETGEDKAQVFLTKFDGDIQSANFISSLQKIK